MSVNRWDGWISMAEAAEILRMTRQGVHHMLRTNKFEDVREVPYGSGKMFFLNEEEVLRIAKSRGLNISDDVTV